MSDPLIQPPILAMLAKRATDKAPPSHLVLAALQRKALEQQAVEEGRRRMSVVEQMLQSQLASQQNQLQEAARAFDPVEDPAAIDFSKQLAQFEDSQKALAEHEMNRRLTMNVAQRIKQGLVPEDHFSAEIRDENGKLRPDPTMSPEEAAWTKRIQEWAQASERDGAPPTPRMLMEEFHNTKVEQAEVSDFSDRFKKRALAGSRSEKLVEDNGKLSLEKATEQKFKENFRRELDALNRSRELAGKPQLTASTGEDIANIIRQNLDGDVESRYVRARKDAQHLLRAAEISQEVRKATEPGLSEKGAANSLKYTWDSIQNNLPTPKKERTEALLSVIQHGSNSDPTILNRLMRKSLPKDDKKLILNRLKWIQSTAQTSEAALGSVKSPNLQYAREASHWIEQALEHHRRGEYAEMFKAMRAGLTAHNIAKRGTAPSREALNLLESWRRQHASLQDSYLAEGRKTSFMKSKELPGRINDMGTLEDSVGSDFNDVEKLQESSKWQNRRDAFEFARGRDARAEDAELNQKLKGQERIAQRHPEIKADIQAGVERRLKEQTSKESLLTWLKKNKTHKSAKRLERMVDSMLGKVQKGPAYRGMPIPVKKMGKPTTFKDTDSILKQVLERRPKKASPIPSESFMSSNKVRQTLEKVLSTHVSGEPINMSWLGKKVAQILARAR